MFVLAFAFTATTPDAAVPTVLLVSAPVCPRPAPARIGVASSVVTVIAAACAVKSTVAYSDGRPLDTNVILLYLLALVSPDKSAKSGLITVIAAPAVACFRNCPVPPVADKLAFVP